jgi:hypothetical protein
MIVTKNEQLHNVLIDPFKRARQEELDNKKHIFRHPLSNSSQLGRVLYAGKCCISSTRSPRIPLDESLNPEYKTPRHKAPTGGGIIDHPLISST